MGLQAIAWAIIMLGTHREYIDPIRREIESVDQGYDCPQEALKKLRLLDSFLRESSRLNPLDGRKYFLC